MPAKISWLVEEKVVVLELIGFVTLEEFEEIASVGYQMIQEADVSLLHLVLDETRLSEIAKNVPQVIKATKRTLSHPHLGWLIFVGIPNEIVVFLTKMVLSAARTRYRIVDTYEEAASALMDVDITLPDLHAIDLVNDRILRYEINGSHVTEYALK